MKEDIFVMLQFHVIIHQMETESSLWNLLLNLNNKISDWYQLTLPFCSYIVTFKEPKYQIPNQRNQTFCHWCKLNGKVRIFYKQ